MFILVYSQLVTMKSVQDLLYESTANLNDSDNEDDDDNNHDNTMMNKKLYDDIRINGYRGHTNEIINVYRNQWCLISDLVCCKLSNGKYMFGAYQQHN